MGFLATLRPATSLASLALTRQQGHGFYSQHHQRVAFRPVESTIRRNSRIKSSSNSDHQQQAAYSVHAGFTDDIMDRYDAFILDQFGVLHNGVAALDGAVDLVKHLFEAKHKKLIILSNTSAPADKALAKLPKFGFQSEHFIGAVTSGEEASHYIRATYGSSSEARKALMLTWDASKPNNPRLTAFPEAFLEQCGNVEIASSVDDADFLLLHGSEVWYHGAHESPMTTSLGSFIEDGGFEVIDPLLEQCRQRNLPAVCANPDFIVQTPDGTGVAYMPGKIAQRYEELGGTCQTFGKPAVEHFEACIRELGIDKTKVAHVGDSLHHDVGGATSAGIPTVFVTSGIHLQELESKFGEIPDSVVLQALLDEQAITPTHVVSAFRL